MDLIRQYSDVSRRAILDEPYLSSITLPPARKRSRRRTKKLNGSWMNRPRSKMYRAFMRADRRRCTRLKQILDNFLRWQVLYDPEIHETA
jgi:hypothetical protein